MRAAICRAPGSLDGLRVEEVADPTPAADGVVIDVHACGVNFPDVLVMEGKYQFKPDPPFSPGGEVAGVVSAVGDTVDGIAAGDRVMASALWGGFAERIAVSATAVHAVPHGMDMVTASVLTGAYGTSLHALRDRAALRAGETLLVLGAAGGVGLAAVELGKAMGAYVIAAASSPDKLALCTERGADAVIDYVAEDLRTSLKSLAGTRSVDVVFDPVGGPYSEPALRTVGWGGRFLVVGFAAGDIPRIPLNLPLLKGCQIVGVFWGAAVGRDPSLLGRTVEELGRMWSDGLIRPHVSHVFPLDQAKEALEMLAARAVRGKLAIVTDAGEDRLRQGAARHRATDPVSAGGTPGSASARAARPKPKSC